MSTPQPNAATRISSFVVLMIFIALALSLTALFLAVQTYQQNPQSEWALYLLLFGFLGAAMSMYVLFQARRRMARLKIEVPPITTTIECKKCGVKNVREFQRGDYVFKEVEPCQKCNEKMLITAIYREVKEKERASQFK